MVAALPHIFLVKSILRNWLQNLIVVLCSKSVQNTRFRLYNMSFLHRLISTGCKQQINVGPMAQDDQYTNTLGSGYEGIAEFYDLFADNSDIPFYLQLAAQYGSPILDLAAGTGRVSFPLAEEGFEVVALERSPSMLRHAREKLALLPAEIQSRLTIIEGDMTAFDIGRQFQLVIIPNSFGHAITTDAQFSTLQCVRDHLTPEGAFVLDLFPGALQHEHARFEDRPVQLPDGSSVSRIGEMHMDPVSQLLNVDLRYVVRDKDGNVKDTVEVSSGAAVIFNREADLLVRMAGLELVAEYGDFECNPYVKDSGRRILVLRKRSE